MRKVIKTPLRADESCSLQKNNREYPPEHPSPNGPKQKKKHLLRGKARRRPRHPSDETHMQPMSPTVKPKPQTPGPRISDHHALPKGKLGPKDIALRRGFGYPPKPATPSPSLGDAVQAASGRAEHAYALCPRLATSSSRDSRPDTKCVCHRPNLSLKSGFVRTSPHIMMGTGCSQTSIRPSHSIQPSAPRPRFTVQ